MKKFIQIPFLVFMILLSVHVLFGQESKSIADGFWGMKFGLSKVECLRIVKAKKNGTIDKRTIASNLIFIDNPEFAGRKTQYITLEFKNGKLITGNVSFKLHSDAEVFEEYNLIKEELNRKYYKTEQDYRRYKPPSHHVDGLELMALKSGYLKISTHWSVNDENNRDIQIGMRINEDLYVFLTYWDVKASEQERLNKKADY